MRLQQLLFPPILGTYWNKKKFPRFSQSGVLIKSQILVCKELHLLHSNSTLLYMFIKEKYHRQVTDIESKLIGMVGSLNQALKLILMYSLRISLVWRRRPFTFPSLR